MAGAVLRTHNPLVLGSIPSCPIFLTEVWTSFGAKLVQTSVCKIGLIHIFGQIAKPHTVSFSRLASSVNRGVVALA
jgi:hypothetical protein